MNNLKSMLIEEVNSVFNKIIKEDKLEASSKIVDILISEGFVQHKINDIYKDNGITQEITIMRLNKYIGQIYADNSSRINELLENAKKTGIPNNPMSIWLSELIEEDLCTGVAPFANTKENVKKIHDIALNFDPLFDAINFELRNVYSYIEENELIKPVSFIEKNIEQEDNSMNNVTESSKLIEDDILPEIEKEDEEEYVSSPFANII